MEDAQNFVDIADTHEFYTCGVLARHAATHCFFKSGRRRVILCQDHGNIRFEDIDTVRMDEYRLGKLIILFNQNKVISARWTFN